MTDLVFKNLTNDKAYTSKFFERILITAIEEIKLGGQNVGISVNLVGEAKIRQLNRRYRNKNKATDVLSFPMKSSSGFQDPSSKTQDFGDVFICLSIAKKEAKRENITMKQKLAQLTVHGFLHLVGYDHDESKKGADTMFGLESKILRKSKF